MEHSVITDYYLEWIRGELYFMIWCDVCCHHFPIAPYQDSPVTCPHCPSKYSFGWDEIIVSEDRDEYPIITDLMRLVDQG
jgi:hypothetical protein